MKGATRLGAWSMFWNHGPIKTYGAGVTDHCDPYDEGLELSLESLTNMV